MDFACAKSLNCVRDGIHEQVNKPFYVRKLSFLRPT